MLSLVVFWVAGMCGMHSDVGSTQFQVACLGCACYVGQRHSRGGWWLIGWSVSVMAIRFALVIGLGLALCGLGSAPLVGLMILGFALRCLGLGPLDVGFSTLC